MTRHSKNATDGAVFTYAERQGMGHGSVHARVGSGSLRAWDACALSLSPAQVPCVTPGGVVYDRGAILHALLAQRRYTRAPTRKLRTASALRAADDGDVDTVHRAAPAGAPTASERAKESSFWLPGAKPVHSAADKEQGALGDGAVRKRRRCPVTKQPLRAKELIDLKPTPAVGAGKGESRFMCPVCRCTLTNSSRPVALRTGTVLCGKCTDNFVRGEATDPVTLKKVDIELDVIVIRHGGTAFAASGGEAKVGSVYHPSAR